VRAPAGFVTGILIGFAFACLANSTLGAELKVNDVNSAEPTKKNLSDEKATPAGVRLLVLLDRAHFSPEEIDGKFGDNAKRHCARMKKRSNFRDRMTSAKTSGRSSLRTIMRF
jgi:hypothetical protein